MVFRGRDANAKLSIILILRAVCNSVTRDKKCVGVCGEVSHDKRSNTRGILETIRDFHYCTFFRKEGTTLKRNVVGINADHVLAHRKTRKKKKWNGLK